MALSSTEQFAAVDVQETATTRVRYDRLAPGGLVRLIVARPSDEASTGGK